MTELLKKRPDLPHARSVLAAAYEATGRLAPAISVLQEQLHFWPNDVRAHLQLAAIFRQQNKIDDAREQLLKAAQIAPEQDRILAQIVELDLSQNNYDLALQRARERMQANPQSAVARYLEGRIFYAQKNYSAAEPLLQQAIALNPNLIEAYEFLAGIYVATNRVAEATKQAEAVAARDAGNTQALLIVGLLRQRTGDFAGAASAYNSCLRLGQIRL